jgi:hypothetical protein
VVKFVSAGPYGAGLHTAVFTDPISCSFPPILTLTQIHGGRPARPARRRPSCSTAARSSSSSMARRGC